MRSILLFIFLLVTAHYSIAQDLGYPVTPNYLPSTMHLSYKIGAGIATQNNYDVGPLAEVELFFPVHHSFDIGFMVQFQEYSLFYHNASPFAPFTPGYAGATLRNKSDYAFFSPEINIPLPIRNAPYMINFYIDGGVGYLLGGSETLHKWDYSYSYPLYTIGNYDTSINTSSNINKLIYRCGFGFTEHAAIYNNFRYFTFTEDFTFAGNLSSTSQANYPGSTEYSPKNMSTVYFNFKIGYSIFHVKKH